jgi:Lon protease-like protein
MTEAQLPTFTLGTVLFPNGLLPLHIYQEQYRRMLRDSQHNDPAFVIALQNGPEAPGDTPLPVGIGTACRISGVTPRPDGRSDIVVTGRYRVRIGDLDWSNGYPVGDIEPIVEVIDDGEAVAARYLALRHRFARYLRLIERLVGDSLPRLDTTDNPATGSWIIGETLTLHTWERQDLLDAVTVDDRLDVIDRFLRREYALLRATGMIGTTIDYPGRKLTLN